MEKILKSIVIILIVLGSLIFVFTSKDIFENLTICVLCVIYLEVIFPDKEK